jgi:hypothetical protein
VTKVNRLRSGLFLVVEKRIAQGGARAGRWLWWQMRSGADGQPHDTVKHAMGKQVVDSFERERRET